MADGAYDHYVPQFLLRRFGRPENPAMLHRLHVEQRRVTPAQVRTEARRKHLDTLPELGEEDDRCVARMFKEIEAHAGSAVPRVCAGRWDFNEADRISVAWLIAIQHLRVPRRIEWIKNMANIAANLLAEQRASDPDNFLDENGRMTKAAKDEQAQLLDDLRAGRVWVKMPEDAARGLAIIEAPRIVWTILNEMRWTLAKASEDREFVLGDDPLTMYDRTPKDEEAAPGFLSSPGAQTAIPLSPTRCLLLTPGPPGFDDIELWPSDVDELNMRSYAWAVSGVYGQSREALRRLQFLAVECRERIEALRPVPPQQFVIESRTGSDRGKLVRYSTGSGRRESVRDVFVRR